jgi:hypothetical protein
LAWGIQQSSDHRVRTVRAVGRPARRQRQLVTLRCAGRDRMAVSGRELPRTRFASWDRIDPSRVLRWVTLTARPQQVSPFGVRQRRPRVVVVVLGVGLGPSRPR